jgi:NADH-quinone oxidoreductase subunit E
MDTVSEETVDQAIARHADRTGDVLGVLEELQEAHPHKYLPKDTLSLVARKMGLTASQIFGVATFYSFFNLEPQGRHAVTVCRGTACHTRGSRKLLSTLCESAGLSAGDEEDGSETSLTTPDRELTVRTVACFGQCALAPVVAVDEDIHGYMDGIRLRGLIQKVRKD